MNSISAVCQHRSFTQRAHGLAGRPLEGAGGVDRRLAADQRQEERQVVVLRLPQCHRHGRRRRAKPPLRHVRARLVSAITYLVPSSLQEKKGHHLPSSALPYAKSTHYAMTC